MERKKCRRCGQQILTGTSNGGRLAAVDLTLDPTALDPLGELHALHAGRRTWTLHPRTDGAGDAYARTMAIIRSRPAGATPRQTVHADHACRPGQGQEGNA